MVFYRGESNTKREIELKTIIEHAENCGSQNQRSFRSNLQVILSPAFLRAYRCVGLLYILFFMSGMFILATYTHTFLEVPYIFALWSRYTVINFHFQFASEQATISIATKQQAIINGSFQLAASLLAPWMLTKMRIRTLFVVSSSFVALSTATGKSQV